MWVWRGFFRRAALDAITAGVNRGVTPIELPNRDAALLWIEKNQLARRNVPDLYRTYLIGDIEEREAKTAREAQLAEARKAKKGGPVVDRTVHDSEPEKERTRSKVAEENGRPLRFCWD